MTKTIETWWTCRIALALALVAGCDGAVPAPVSVPAPVVAPARWLGIPTAQDVPCDRDGIPSEASIERLRSAIEEIKAKMKRLQN